MCDTVADHCRTEIHANGHGRVQQLGKLPGRDRFTDRNAHSRNLQPAGSG